MQIHRREISVWTATHDNGWITKAVENPDGSYAAWATKEPDALGPVDYVEDGLEKGKRAAECALRQRTGHERCTGACSGWTMPIYQTIVSDSAER